MSDRTSAESDPKDELELLRRRVAELSDANRELAEAVAHLQDRQGLSRSLIDTSPCAVTVTDLQGKITSVSRAAVRLYGYESADELIGKSTIDTVSPEDRAKAKEELNRILEEGSLCNVDIRLLKKDGTVFLGEFNSGVVRTHDGEPHSIVAVVRDITSQRAMEEALRSSEEKFRDLVENMNDAIYRLGIDGSIDYASPAIESIIGYSPSELLGTKISDYIHPEDVERAAAAMKSVLDGRLSPKEVRVITRSGEEKWVRVSSRSVTVEGVPVGLQGVLTDITERKRAEKEAGFLASVIAKLKDGCIVTDLDYEIVYVNEAAQELFGYTREELIGKTPDVLNAEPMAESVQREIYETVSNGGVWESAIRNKRKDGSIFINQFAVSPLEDENGRVKYYIGIQRDVTEKTRLELELKQAQKMEAVGTMAGGIAHDFNNLLTAILGYSELLMAECEPGSIVRKDVEEIDKTARRAAALTKRLLAFSKGQMVQVAPVDINGVVTGLEKMLRRLIGEDVELRTNLAEGLPKVDADAGQIEQVVVNLALNARDAMPDGGSLTVGTEAVTLEQDECASRPEARPGEWACLKIADTGHGMEAKVADRIFEPFYTTKEVGKGTGLGLSVVFGIIKAHHGWIEVDSEPSAGSEFRIFIPLSAGKPRVGGPAKAGGTDSGRGAERVLVVEDQEEVRALALRALTKEGYKVFEAADAAEALDVYEKEGGRFDILFSDVVLPDLSGVELAGRIRAKDPGISVLLTSGYTDRRLHWSVIEERGYVFLKKPYELSGLVGAVRESLNRRAKKT
jgi:PAS domain S-box-containing protein